MTDTMPAETEASDATAPPETQGAAPAIHPDFRTILDSHAAYSSFFVRRQDKEISELGWRAMRGAVADIDPKDTVEGMLAAQLIGLYNATMSSIGRSTGTESFNSRNIELGNASKLSRSFAAVLEALIHYRGKGNSQQTITVQHVNVAGGGQAVVAGNVSP